MASENAVADSEDGQKFSLSLAFSVYGHFGMCY